MAFRLNTTHCNTKVGAIRTAYAGASLQIRTGTQPTSANDSATGTLLCTITLPSPAFNTASSGAITKTGTWSGTATTSGTASWVRFIATGGEQMDAAIGTDLTIDNSNITNGGTVTVTSFTYTQPSS